MLKNPCYDAETHTDCKDRCTGCSIICALWHDYEERRREEYQRRKKLAQERSDIVEHKIDAYNRTIKRNHKK